MSRKEFVALALALAWLLALEPCLAESKAPPLPRRYTFKIDPKTPAKDLLPTPPEVKPALAPWLVKELAETPEVLFEKRAVVRPPADATAKMTNEERQKLIRQFAEERARAEERTAHVLAKINHLNAPERDRFLKELLARRSDLAGLPFAMGDACRMAAGRSRAFVGEVNRVRNALMAATGAKREPATVRDGDERPPFWRWYELGLNQPGVRKSVEDREAVVRDGLPARAAALAQILAPHGWDTRMGLAKYLAEVENADSTRVLARLAIFSEEKKVREPALAALKTRRAEDSTDVLLAGLRHPWPAAAESAGAAIAKLDRKDLIPELVKLLDEPDPRAPAERNVGGKKVLAVRELVRLNHHRNCLLCHPPANTPDVKIGTFGQIDDLVTGPVPNPYQELPSPSQGYRRFASPDILVRADVTYLRQDFSAFLIVKDAQPWPQQQRFDFLVRTRLVTTKEAEAYRAWLTAQGPDYLPPHRRAALTALRALTGRDAAPTAAAWRRALAPR